MLLFARFLHSQDEMRRQTIKKFLLTLGALIFLGLGTYHAELLRSAFQRNPIARSDESISRGRKIFESNCAVCHGAEGRGDGPAAAALPKRPDDLSQIAPPPVFPDGVVAYRILNGVDMMPAFKSTLGADEVWDVLNFVRSLAPAK